MNRLSYLWINLQFPKNFETLSQINFHIQCIEIGSGDIGKQKQLTEEKIRRAFSDTIY